MIEGDALKSRRALVELEEGSADDLFLDDLSAVNRLKSFLVGIGTTVPPKTSQGISELITTFAFDLYRFEDERRLYLYPDEHREERAPSQISDSVFGRIFRWFR
jgi:hypothetical protein